jgi:hypothetical protein
VGEDAWWEVFLWRFMKPMSRQVFPHDMSRIEVNGEADGFEGIGFMVDELRVATGGVLELEDLFI